jgi:hypothetical protein
VVAASDAIGIVEFFVVAVFHRVTVFP